ncbi:MAG: hypothetical protein SynsKO_30060 [Synoicihabitans sp.]
MVGIVRCEHDIEPTVVLFALDKRVAEIDHTVAVAEVEFSEAEGGGQNKGGEEAEEFSHRVHGGVTEKEEGGIKPRGTLNRRNCEAIACVAEKEKENE